MSYSTLSTRIRRFVRKRGGQESLAQIRDPRQAKGRRWPLGRVMETVLGGLLLQIGSCHRLDERTRTGPPLRVGELRLAPIPDATLQWILPQLDPEEVRQVVVKHVRTEVRRKSVASPPGAICTLAIDGKCLWSGRRGAARTASSKAQGGCIGSCGRC